MIEDYTTVVGENTGELTLKGSRFIGISLPCPDEDSIRRNLDLVQGRWRDATHYCWAAVYGGPLRRERSSDNGEPSGTAGKPILNVLRGSGLSDTMIVVTRYFGGTLLGTGGLVKAYTEGAAVALSGARTVVLTACCEYMLRMDYSTFSSFQSKMSDMMACRPECVYTEEVEMKVKVPIGRRDEFLRRLADLTDRKARPIELPDCYIQ